MSLKDAIFSTSRIEKIDNKGNKYHALKTTKNEQNEELVIKYIVLLITQFNQYFNLPQGKFMNDIQIVDLAFSLYSDMILHGYSMNDFIIFFDGAKSQKYGKIFDRIDSSVILEMLDVYHLQREKKRIELEEIKESKMKKGIYEDNEEKECISPEKFSEFIKEFERKAREYKKEKHLTKEQMLEKRKERRDLIHDAFNKKYGIDPEEK